MIETTMRSVDESLEEIKSDVEAMLGVDVDAVEVEQFGTVAVRIALTDPAVVECCQHPTFGVDRALESDIEVRYGRSDVRVPDCDIELRFGQLFPEYCGPTSLEAERSRR